MLSFCVEIRCRDLVLDAKDDSDRKPSRMKTRIGNANKRYGKVDLPNSDDPSEEQAKFKKRKKRNQTDEDVTDQQALEEKAARAEEVAAAAREQIRKLKLEEKKSKGRSRGNRASRTKEPEDTGVPIPNPDGVDGAGHAHQTSDIEAHHDVPLGYAETKDSKRSTLSKRY